MGIVRAPCITAVPVKKRSDTQYWLNQNALRMVNAYAKQVWEGREGAGVCGDGG